VKPQPAIRSVQACRRSCTTTRRADTHPNSVTSDPALHQLVPYPQQPEHHACRTRTGTHTTRTAAPVPTRSRSPDSATRWTSTGVREVYHATVPRSGGRWKAGASTGATEHNRQFGRPPTCATWFTACDNSIAVDLPGCS
jgi:hypothetical protein